MSALTRACIGLGANLGDTRRTIIAAADELAEVPGIALCSLSPLYVSAPVDAGGPDFINAVALVDSGLSAAELLAQMQCIETAHGRGRPYRHAPRTLDLDLLLYGNLCLNTPALTLPHPRLHERAFVLLPLLDVWPDAVIPGLGSAADWLPHVGEQRIQRLAE